MDLIKELKHAYKCDTLKELADVLGMKPNTLRSWRTMGVPAKKRRLLEIILEQKNNERGAT